MHPRLGDPGANLALHREWMGRAREAGADLLVFPELSLTGYCLRDLASSMATPVKEGPLAALAREAGDMAVMVGAVLPSRAGPPSNAAVLLERGQPVLVELAVCLGFHDQLHLPAISIRWSRGISFPGRSTFQ